MKGKERKTNLNTDWIFAYLLSTQQTYICNPVPGSVIRVNTLRTSMIIFFLLAQHLVEASTQVRKYLQHFVVSLEEVGL